MQYDDCHGTSGGSTITVVVMTLRLAICLCNLPLQFVGKWADVVSRGDGVYNLRLGSVQFGCGRGLVIALAVRTRLTLSCPFSPTVPWKRGSGKGLDEACTGGHFLEGKWLPSESSSDRDSGQDEIPLHLLSLF